LSSIIIVKKQAVVGRNDNAVAVTKTDIIPGCVEFGEIGVIGFNLGNLKSAP